MTLTTTVTMTGIPRAVAEQESLTEQLVSPEPTSLRRELLRAGQGLALASVYGLALGVRDGGTALLHHALGVPLGLAAATALGVPSLFVALALTSAPLCSRAALSATSRALGVAGLMLAGLAPVAALFLVTMESNALATVAGSAGLLGVGAVALVYLLQGLSRAMQGTSLLPRASGNLVLSLFAVFAVGLCLRIWCVTLPAWGGAA